ncbi:hypothetical protein F4604DRAFT_1673777 [Suillus subluteus]|nr:hypothetical protein F4604DRAFT_1673777 [Suillus subluteus]
MVEVMSTDLKHLSGAMTTVQQADNHVIEYMRPQQIHTPTGVVLATPWMVWEVYTYLPMLRDVLAWQDSSHWTWPPFIGNNVPTLCYLMHTWGVVITGSCTLEMLLGQHQATNNLNLIILKGSFDVLQEFVVESLCYHHSNAVTHLHHAFYSVVQTFAKYHHGGLCITVSEAFADDIFNVLTSSPTMGDMVFMTPGGTAAFYPNFTFNVIAIHNSTLKQQPQSSFLPPRPAPADRRAVREQEAHMRHHLHSDVHTYTGMLYATWASAPKLLKHINNLEVLHWLDCLGDDNFNVDTAQACKTYNIIAQASYPSYGFGYTFFREHPVLFTPPNGLIGDITAGITMGNSVSGNVLVVKHTKGNKHDIVNLTVVDMECVNEVVRCTIIHAEFWT